MTFCYFSCLGLYCFRPTSMAALQLLELTRCPDPMFIPCSTSSSEFRVLYLQVPHHSLYLIVVHTLIWLYGNKSLIQNVEHFLFFRLVIGNQNP